MTTDTDRKLLEAAAPIQMEPVAYRTTNGLTVERAGVLDPAWAVRDGWGNCLSTGGDWVHEPMPSNRTAKWLPLHRFHTPAEALGAIRAAAAMDAQKEQTR